MFLDKEAGWQMVLFPASTECDDDPNSSVPEANGAILQMWHPRSLSGQNGIYLRRDTGARKPGRCNVTPLRCANTACKLVTAHVCSGCGWSEGLIASFCWSAALKCPKKREGKPNLECVSAGLLCVPSLNLHIVVRKRFLREC